MKNMINRVSILMSFCLITVSCSSQSKEVSKDARKTDVNIKTKNEIKTGAENFESYLSLLKNKKVGIVTNQTGIISKNEGIINDEVIIKHISIVDFFIENKVNVQKIYAPEHGFRGTADAGELIKDGKDTKTGLPIISLYGDNKKPKPEQLKGIDVMVFDLQDVGARFYTYISSLHYVMEACAENNIPLLVLDRPNPNGGIIDGPVLEKEHTSFVGMHPIPVLHGMTIGEYAKMINGEKWLKEGIQCDLKVIPCLNYKHDMYYHLPVKPSPNLTNNHAINLYASLCFFEGTNVSVGRGTDNPFEQYGSPFLPENIYWFNFTPESRPGAKDPMHNGKKCYGEILSNIAPVEKLELKWLIDSYNFTKDKSTFFNSFFTKLAGTTELQQQIEKGYDEEAIRISWTKGLKEFKEKRKKYLIYE